MEPFATIDDLETLWRQLKPDETGRAEALLPVVSDALREEGLRAGVDIDAMVSIRPSYATIVKSVTVDVVARTLMTSTSQEPMSQYSQGALGYTVSGTYLVPGGGLFIKNAELNRLGLRRQRYGVIDFYDD